MIEIAPEDGKEQILKPEVVADINALWEIFIDDGTDVVKISKLVTIMWALDVEPVDDVDVNNLVKQADPNNEGVFTKEALVAIMEEKLRDTDTIEELIEWFKLLDWGG